MSALVVHNVYKKFGKPADPFWKRLPRLTGAKNGKANPKNETGNGHKPDPADCNPAPARRTHPWADPRSKREVQTIVRELRAEQGTTNLLTTHDMNEAEMLCDRIAIMDSGKVVTLDTPAALKQLIAAKDGKDPTLEDVSLELTGKKLVNPGEESTP